MVEKNINELEAVSDVVMKMTTVLKTKVKDAAVAVPGSAVITKTITMLLGDLPYIGNLFRRTENTETKTELLIFITPSIINET